MAHARKLNQPKSNTVDIVETKPTKIASPSRRKSSPKRHRQSLSAEDIVVIIAIVMTLLLAPILTMLWYMKDPILVPPPIIAIFLGIAVSSILYRFLGGVHNASFTIGALKVTGSAAILIFVAWWANDELKTFMPVLTLKKPAFDLAKDVVPTHTSWYAVSTATGNPISLNFPHHQQQHLAPSFARLSEQNLQRSLNLHQGDDGIVVAVDNHARHIIGTLSQGELNELGFFNKVDMRLNPFEVATFGALQGIDMSSKLPFTIHTKGFSENYTRFALKSRIDDQVIYEDSILLRGAKLFQYHDQYYLISVVQVNHAPEDIEPYAKIYLAELSVSYL
ncbi:hypothetical protein [Shewanella surugensis]|uniref:Uncharacterized protein n=1 Tax=Shewanella surugensis TaxID=212020 RepID=A0ABT0L7V9_9GAMM|nr:hypothetical protein [Shewanella surugensis]MCL1123772.1 hypothetical protein [Shewanella surugensis]